MLSTTIEGGGQGLRLLPARAGRVERPASGAVAGPGLLAMLVRDAPLGMLLVGPTLRLVYANHKGLEILEQDDAIGLAGGVLCERAGNALESRLRALLRGDAGEGGDSEAPFHLPRRSGLRPYEVTLRTASRPGRSGALAGMPHVIVYLRDPEAGVAIDEEAIRSRYRLSPAEARTAAALARSGELSQHPDLGKLRRTTIRGYLKQIFAKTGAHSQADLVRLLLTGAASLAGRR